MSQKSQINKQRQSNQKQDKQIWGKLVALSLGYGSYKLDKPSIIIGRASTVDIKINDNKISLKHCQLKKIQDKITLTDLSSNGTFVDMDKIGKGNTVELNHNDEIWLLPPSKVQRNQSVGFRLQIIDKNGNKEEDGQEISQSLNKSQRKLRSSDKKQIKQQKKQDNEQKQQNQKQQKKPQKKDTLTQSIKNQLICPFCLQIMHMPVTIQPCTHRFCGGCLSQLLSKKNDICIKCRNKIISGVRDTSFQSLVDDYLKNHPQDQRDQKQLEILKNKNIFNFVPVFVDNQDNRRRGRQRISNDSNQRRGRGRRRPINRRSSDLSASDDDQQRCRECMTARNGFQCGPNQQHIACFTCGKLMPNRNNRDLHQNCILCHQNFCNIYYPPCSRSGIKLSLVKDHKQQSKIDVQLLRSNKYEFEYIRNYLLSKKLTSKDVFEYILTKMDNNQFNYIINKKIMKIPPILSQEIPISRDDAICDICWKDVWFQMVFYYRGLIHNQLPDAVKNKPVCYWGINCNTMDHHDAHASKYNHMVFQTRF